MSEFRRRLMMVGGGQSPTDYITDGLVFHLDGADFNGTWTDRIGNNTYTKAGTISSNGDGGVSFNKGHLSGNAVGYDYTLSTIEICAKVNSKPSGNGSALFHQGNGNYIMYLISPSFSNVQYKTSSYDSKIVGDMFSKFTHSMSISNNYFNKTPYGNETLTSRWNYAAPSGKLIIGNYGASNYNNCFIGVLYQVRIYSRILTIDEILYNQQIDIYKYNIIV